MAQSSGSVRWSRARMVFSKVRSPPSAAMASRRARASRSSSAAAGSTCSARMRSNGIRNSSARSGFGWLGFGTLSRVSGAFEELQNGYHRESMGSNENGTPSRVPAEEQLNVFALVIYVPEPLGRFLDDLRRELSPASNPHAHVSVLPPRPLAEELPPQEVRAIHELARRRWKEYRGSSVFRAERTVFVQNTLDNCWIDLAEYSLGAIAVR